MSSGLDVNSPAVVDAFHSALRQQGVAVLLLVALVPVVWTFWRRRLASDREPPTGTGAEASGRRFVRYAFGGLWTLDGFLQLQQSMPLGLVPKVVAPAAASSPGWVQHIVSDTSLVWSDHPVTAAAATVWIQLGIGLWLLLANSGLASRLAGVASAAWATVVWVSGNAFGGLFGSGLSWLTGAPGAVALYAVAGVLVALPEDRWRGERLGRLALRTGGVYLLGFAVLQAWPGRGFWQGQAPGASPGSLTSSLQSAAGTPQPGWLHAVVNAFADFDASHGWAVNLAVVVVLASLGTALVAGSARRVLDVAVAGTVALCVADWVVVQDLGFLGGVGTDPNSMLPTAALVAAAWLAASRPAPALGDGVVELRPTADRAVPAWRRVTPSAALRLTGSAAALAIVAVGAVPLAADAAEPRASTIITTALDGPPQALDVAGRPFELTDATGARVDLASLRGRTVAVTFLDPVCTSDCPIIAQEFAQADRILGDPSRTAFVAVDINPSYLSPSYLQAFDDQEHLASLGNWHYLTGPLPELQAVWKEYGAYVAATPGGGMIDHNDISYVIGPDGRLRYELDADPGPGTSSTMSSFAATLAGAMNRVEGR